MICTFCWEPLKDGDNFLAGFSDYKKVRCVEDHKFDGRIYHYRCLKICVEIRKKEEQTENEPR